MALKDARNILIVLVLAAVVDIVPGGGTGASVVIQAITLIFLGAFAWILSLMYREHRNAIYALGERRRVGLYVAAGVLAVTLTATHRLWSSPIGSVVWLLLVGGALYVAGAVFFSARRY